LKVGVIVQARMGSSRLPGKVLLPLKGAPVVHHVLKRVQSMRSAHVVCLATSDRPTDKPIADIVKPLGVHIFRGSEADVLDRYLRAAREIQADVVVRVTCDCPLIDPAVCDSLVQFHAENSLDIASVDHPSGWPQGLDCEVFTRELLERCASRAIGREEREHVTTWMYDRNGVSARSMIGPGRAAADHRWVIDYPEDYQYLKRLFEYLPAPPAIPSWQQVMQIAEAHPELSSINSERKVALL
jgi:spore coat polysaccharide biosynthesis protein SpsF